MPIKSFLSYRRDGSAEHGTQRKHSLWVVALSALIWAAVSAGVFAVYWTIIVSELSPINDFLTAEGVLIILFLMLARRIRRSHAIVRAAVIGLVSSLTSCALSQAIDCWQHPDKDFLVLIMAAIHILCSGFLVVCLQRLHPRRGVDIV